MSEDKKFLTDLKEQLQNSGEELDEIYDLYKKKLWHNLTEKIENFINKVKDWKILLQFYENFLIKFEMKLNFFKLANIMVLITIQIKGNFLYIKKIIEPEKAIAILNDVGDKCEKKNAEEAACILRVEVAFWKLKVGDMKECKSILRKTKDFIEKVDFVDNQVNSSYYDIETEFFRATQNFNEHYKSSLLYLAYTPMESINQERRLSLSYNLGHSALLGSKIYNFGELVKKIN
jgi:26S proteasome regulatory subunit N9